MYRLSQCQSHIINLISDINSIEKWAFSRTWRIQELAPPRVSRWKPEIGNPHHVLHALSSLTLVVGDVICFEKLSSKISLCIATAAHANAIRFRVYDTSEHLYSTLVRSFDLHLHVPSRRIFVGEPERCSVGPICRMRFNLSRVQKHAVRGRTCISRFLKGKTFEL